VSVRISHSKSVSLASPCFSTSLETAQGPRQPHGAQTIVIVGSRMSESVRVPGRGMTHDRTNSELEAGVKDRLRPASIACVSIMRM
jgi:hypothetical protein